MMLPLLYFYEENKNIEFFFLLIFSLGEEDEVRRLRRINIRRRSRARSLTTHKGKISKKMEVPGIEPGSANLQKQRLRAYLVI